MTSSDEPLTLQEAADELGVHYMTAYRYVRTGRLPGTKVRGMWQVQRSDLGALDEEAPSGDGRQRAPHARRLEARLVLGDEAGAWAVIEAALTGGMDPEDVYRELLAPALRSIGDRWESGDIGVDEEHLATNVTLRLVGRLGPRFARRGRKRGRVVLGCAPGESHGLPTALAADLLRARGYEVIDLGADVPADSFADAVRNAPDVLVVGVCATTGDNEDSIEQALLALRAACDVPVIVGGPGVPDEAWLQARGAAWRTETVDELLERVDEIAGGVAA